MIGLLVTLVGFASGAVIGLIGGMLGIGGGMIAIPAFGLLLNMDQQMAQGTALILVLPTILVSLRKYTQQTPIDWKVAGAGASSTLVFSSLGAQAALGLDPVLLRQSFAIFIFFLALFCLWCIYKMPKPSEQPRLAFGRWHAFGLGVLAGSLGGFFGVGGAMLVIPIMTSVFGLRQTMAQSFAISMMIPGACIALFMYTLAGQADWAVGVPIALGSVFLVPTGVKIALKMSERRLRLAFAALLFSVVPLLLFHRG